jgi:hypothetical protein
MSVPRKPGSQVAPNQKPLFTDRKTASTHSKIPIEQATAGKLYRVRDKHYEGKPGQVWGDNLSWADACKLKDQVVASGKSRTARAEDMAVPMPGEPPAEDLAVDEAPPEVQDLGVDEEGPTVKLVGELGVAPGQGTAFELMSTDPQVVPYRGVVIRIPPGHELLVDGQVMPLPVSVAVGQVLLARALDPEIAAAQAAALAAVRPVAAASQARRPAPAYRDKTVVRPKPRAAPPPPDKTVSKDPPLVRLGAPPQPATKPPVSPLKVATQLDGDPIPDGVLGETDLHDLDVGGGPSDDDVAHARAQRDADERARAGG